MKDILDLPSQDKDRGCRLCRGSKSCGSKVIIAIVVLAIVAAAGFAGYTYYKKGSLSPAGSVTGTAAQDDTKEIAGLVKEIGKLIVLPAGEQPVLATVKDAASLASQQPFFVGAQNGDKLLIYQQARKAFLYSVATGKLVNVGPVMNDQAAAEQKQAPAPATAPTEKKK